MSVNKAILVGNLGKDPDLRYTPSGTAVCTFSLATTERFKNKQGEQQDKTEWHNIVVWAGLAEICGKYLTKGKQIYIEGRIQNRSYDDRDGNKRYISEIVVNEMQMLGRAGEQGSGGGGGGDYAPQNNAPAGCGKRRPHANTPARGPAEALTTISRSSQCLKRDFPEKIDAKIRRAWLGRAVCISGSHGSAGANGPCLARRPRSWRPGNGHCGSVLARVS